MEKKQKKLTEDLAKLQVDKSTNQKQEKEKDKEEDGEEKDQKEGVEMTNDFEGDLEAYKSRNEG